ncbi:putative Iron uptake protein A1 [Candidatus Xenohaliotis californiensis]|uniref:Iron uptake protein A1 n=1 Tax=Candidatus Xenohaliotis californiensis TaxID=84677 RepID=A0ABM9N9A3_9RICK|nr:putative Iron uptake protein A1 [Candidatus Xenohaliotis californiensis]
MVKKSAVLLIIVLLAIIFQIIFNNKELLNIYSTREEELLKDVVAEFTKKTGVKVHVFYGDTLPLLTCNKKNAKKNINAADLLISSNNIIMALLANKSMLQPIRIDNIVEQKWIPISKNPQLIVYIKDRMELGNRIENYEDLSNVKWHNRIIISESKEANNYSLLTFLIAHFGQEYAKIWLSGLINNLAHEPFPNEQDQLKALISKKADIAVISCSILAKLLQKDEKISNKIKVVFPNQQNYGLHTNFSGIGLFKTAKNKNNALKFIQYIITKDGQKLYAIKNNEYPVNNDTPLSPLLQNWSGFKEDTKTNDSLIYYARDALKMANTVGWR